MLNAELREDVMQPKLFLGMINYYYIQFFVSLIRIHYMQGWTAATRQSYDKNAKRLKHAGNLCRKKLKVPLILNIKPFRS